MMKTLEFITVNTAPISARRVSLRGRSYLIAPSTLLVPGVLAGSNGPLYYPPEHVSRNPQDWNGMPLVVGHPTMNGMPISARDPDVAESRQVGSVYRTCYRGDKLTAEAWFDEEIANQVDERIVQKLGAGESLELSTGLSVDKLPAPEGATHNGRPYSYIAVNYRPDHLAVLLDQVGACSIADGCGVLANAGDWQSFDAVVSRSEWLPLGEPVLTTNAAGDLPSETLDMDPVKCCKILKDGAVHGKELTESQRGMFGACCGERDKKTSNEMNWTPLANAFCATGAGGGIDPTCQPGGGGGGGSSSGGGGSSGGSKGGSSAAAATRAAIEKSRAAIEHTTSRSANENAAAAHRTAAEAHRMAAVKAHERGNAAKANEHQKMYEQHHRTAMFHQDNAALATRNEFVANAYDASYEDKRQQLMVQLGERFPPQKPTDGPNTSYPIGPYIVDLYDGYVVFSADLDNDGPLELYRLDYTEDVGGCTLAEDDPVEVRRITTYEPIGNAAVRMDGESSLSASDFAYTPDLKDHATWKLRIDDTAHVGAAVAAIGKGFRGQKVDIPAKDMPGVKKRIAAAWRKFNKDKDPAEMPEIIRNAESRCAGTQWETISSAF